MNLIPVLYTVDQLAAMFSVTPRVVKAWARAENIKAKVLPRTAQYRLGYVFTEEAVENFIEAHRVVLPPQN